MSGRGRGRGRGGAPASGGLLLLRRSAEECGLDSRNIRSLGDITRPPLYPDIELHSSGDASSASGDQPAQSTSTSNTAVKRSAQAIYLISKSREIHHRITNSVFYVQPTKDVPDVLRYSDYKRKLDRKGIDTSKNNDASFVLAHCLGGIKETEMGRFVPEELVSGQKRLRRTFATDVDGYAQDDTAFEDLDVKGRLRRQRADSTASAGAGQKENGENEEEREDEFYEHEDEDEAEELEDYVINHYESETESDGGGDDEPTY